MNISDFKIIALSMHGTKRGVVLSDKAGLRVLS